MTALRGWLLTIALLCPAAGSFALPPEGAWGDEGFAFRLLLGSFDGNENSRLLHHDSHRYALALSATSPVGWNGRLEAELEFRANERGYPAATTSDGEATGTLTLEAMALSYGLRAHTLTSLRPYASLTAGFQGTRLEGRTLAAPSVTVKEENVVPTAQIGLGLEWEIGQDIFSVDWRHSYAKGDFTEFGARGLDLGGDYLGIGLGHRW